MHRWSAMCLRPFGTVGMSSRVGENALIRRVLREQGDNSREGL